MNHISAPATGAACITGQLLLHELAAVGSLWELPVVDYDQPSPDGYPPPVYGEDGQPAIRVDQVVAHWKAAGQLGVSYVTVQRTPGCPDDTAYGWSGALVFVANRLRVPQTRVFPAAWSVDSAAGREYLLRPPVAR